MSRGGMVVWCLALLPHTSRTWVQVSIMAPYVWSLHALPVEFLVGSLVSLPQSENMLWLV